MVEELPGRQDLVRWNESRPTNYYDASTNLRDVLDARAGPARRLEMERRLRDFGAVVAATIDPAVEAQEQHREMPRHVPYDAVGRRSERIEFHPAQARASAAVWDSGLLACGEGPGGAFEQAALFYLPSHVGEGGVGCPAVCTAGLGRAVASRGSPELARRYLGGLRSASFAGSLRGSQFRTEVQGGSDVGANVVATSDSTEPGAWRITGEKWFCSVADADLFAVTARPESAPDGTRGLGCFLVPRMVEGAPIEKPEKIICVGLNYRDHARETGATIPAEPILFMKALNCMVMPHDEILVPRGSLKTDWEVELGVVIGQRARYPSSPDAAIEVIAGYAASHDVSEGEFQIDRGGQWDEGKSCETFNPLGPWLVTPDEVPDPQALALHLSVNGVVRQNGSTADMVFGVHYLVWYISQFMVLEPGDLINTGTPAGVSMGHDDVAYLKAGDVVELGVEGLGRQRSLLGQA